MKTVLTLCIALVVLAAGALLYAWSGMYNIAATQPHWGVTLSFIEMLKERSVETHSSGVQIASTDDPDLREKALPHYHEMCRLCHGAPGYAPLEFTKGLYPAPPPMASGHIQEEMDASEIYWVVKHGIKMTGMPAFGPTHDEAELRGLTALASQMSRMTPEQYREQVEAMESSHGHTHGEARESAPEENGHHGENESQAHEDDPHAH